MGTPHCGFSVSALLYRQTHQSSSRCLVWPGQQQEELVPHHFGGCGVLWAQKEREMNESAGGSRIAVLE